MQYNARRVAMSRDSPSEGTVPYDLTMSRDSPSEGTVPYAFIWEFSQFPSCGAGHAKKSSEAAAPGSPTPGPEGMIARVVTGSPWPLTVRDPDPQS
jgi:hypothetical protein